MTRALHVTYRTARRIVVGVVGVSVVAIGGAMLVLPGPGMVVIPAGLAILGLEFAWARRWLRTLRERGRAIVSSWNGEPGCRDGEAASPAQLRAESSREASADRSGQRSQSTSPQSS